MLKQLLSRVLMGRTSVGQALEPGERPDAAFEANWRRQVKARVLLAVAFLGLWAVALEARLVYLQVLEHREFAARAEQQQSNVIEPAAARGDIVARNGELLAYSVQSHRVIADPKLVKDPRLEATAICAALGDCTAKDLADLIEGLTRGKNRGDRYLLVRNHRFVSPQAAARIAQLIETRRTARQDVVLSLVPESRRFYPKERLAASLLGFVDADGKGAEGLESRYNELIAGEKGRVIVQVDGLGQREIATRVERAPTAGATLELTIDLRVQHIVERELRAAVEAAGADGGSVVVLDPRTGEVLAIASYPTFNPNIFWQQAADLRRNRAVSDTYEPGSTFKIVTAAAALNEGLFSTAEPIDTNPGVFRLPGRVIDEDHGKNYGVLSFADVLIRSSNVGAIMIGNRIGADRLMQYVRRFGFGEKLSPDFPGQSRGRVAAASSVGDSALASIAMGYEIAVTPLQVAVAANVVANDGVLVEPRVVRAVVRNGRREAFEPRVLRRVITPETAATLTALMEGVAERGTAKGAALELYRVAGKTGTAAKIVNGRYSKSEYNVSFVGFAPSRNPALTMLVVIDTPRRVPAYGGTVAAPVFRRIAESVLPLLGVPPSINAVPPIIMAGDRPAPQPSADLPPAITRVGGRSVMPDLRGLTLRAALRLTNSLGLSMTFEGDGFVVDQVPAAGEFVDAEVSGVLQLRRHPTGERGGR